ncbi:MAG: hypothetical protein Q4E13_07220 [Clostridia bacterium]|nr:hypothetical protein [Clostridia bacterium]
MAPLKDRFLYGASGKRAPRPDAPREKRPRGALLRPFFRNFGTMVQYNLVALLFFLPGIGWSGVNLILLFEQAAGAASLAQWIEAAFPVLSTWLLVMIPLWGLADVGACGASGIFRRVLEGKKIRHWQDFSTAVRRNGLAAFLFGMLRGALWWMLLTAEHFYFVLAEGGAPQFRVLQVLGACVFLGVLNVEGLFLPALQGSRGRWMDAIRSAVSQAVWHMPACLSVVALTVALPLLLTLIPVVGVFAWGAYELVAGLSARQYAFTAVAALLGLGGVEDEDGEED